MFVSSVSLTLESSCCSTHTAVLTVCLCPCFVRVLSVIACSIQWKGFTYVESWLKEAQPKRRSPGPTGAPGPAAPSASSIPIPSRLLSSLRPGLEAWDRLNLCARCRRQTAPMWKRNTEETFLRERGEERWYFPAGCEWEAVLFFPHWSLGQQETTGNIKQGEKKQNKNSWRSDVTYPALIGWKQDLLS